MSKIYLNKSLSIKMKYFLLTFFVFLINPIAHALDVRNFDINGFKLRQTIDQVKDKHPCTQTFKTDYPSKGVSMCFVQSVDKKITKNGITEEELSISFDMDGKAMRINKTISFLNTSDSQLELIKSILLQVHQHSPNIISNFTIGDVPYDAYCWGDCTTSGNSYKKGVNGGSSYSMIIRNTVRTQIMFELEDRELFEKLFAYRKQSKKE